MGKFKPWSVNHAAVQLLLTFDIKPNGLHNSIYTILRFFATKRTSVWFQIEEKAVTILVPIEQEGRIISLSVTGHNYAFS